MFKKIEDYPRYSVNKKGDVRNDLTGRMLKRRTSGKGYFCYNLYNDEGNKNKTIHRLVAQAFIPNPNNLPMVDHIDADKSNNNVDNLRWVTNYQNLNHYGFEKLKEHSIEAVGVGVVAVKGNVRLEFRTKSDLLRHFGYKTVRTRVKIGEVYNHGKMKGYTVYYL